MSNPKEVIQYSDLPSEEEYFDQIKLTSELIWHNKLSKPNVEDWLLNFNGTVFKKPYERQLALHLLANFVYYNEDEVRHLCKTLYNDFIHHVLCLQRNPKEFNIDLKLDEILYSTRFYHLGKPGESGAYILYYFRQENKLPLENFIAYAKKPPTHVNTLVFIDDVTISGIQARKYLERETISYDKDKIKILLTFISTEEAVKVLKQDDIQVISCITLDNRSKCFSDTSDLFHHYKERYRQDCMKFAKEYGKISLRSYPSYNNPLGFDDGQYAFGFFYNTPDNILPIFWVNSEDWVPIMRRYEKFSEGFHGKLGRFV